jgi:hypothetical protein
MLQRLSLLGLLVCTLAGCPNGAGITCPSGASLCNLQCVALASDPANCGACGSKCAADHYCVSGQCVFGCPSPLSICGSACVDEQHDPMNCGSCGNSCAADHYCVGGTCIFGCPLTKCMNDTICVDTNVDVNNCGSCGNACTMNNICCAGHCENFNTVMHCGGCAPCPAPDSCVDYMGTGVFMCLNLT